MGHDFKVGDLAVVLYSEVGNTGKIVRIVQETYASDSGHDLVAEAMDEAGLNYVYFTVSEDGEIVDAEDIAMQIPMKSRHLQKIEAAAGK
jgi:hypothetical protein